MNTALWICHGILAAIFLFSGMHIAPQRVSVHRSVALPHTPPPHAGGLVSRVRYPLIRDEVSHREPRGHLATASSLVALRAM
jgi:hypothetical protein